MSEAIPQHIYDAELRERRRIGEASGVSLVSAYILRTAVQLELFDNNGVPYDE
jgi:hypothetical protein